jgi:hypothetical protein
MASGPYTQGLLNIFNGTIDPDTTPLKFILLKNTYVFDRNHNFVDSLSASELAATGYTGGFGGAGRKAAAVTVTRQTASNRVVLIFTDPTWTALGGAVQDTVGGIALIREITNDASSIPIAFFDVTDTPTNGSDISFDFDGVNGNIQINANLT